MNPMIPVAISSGCMMNSWATSSRPTLSNPGSSDIFLSAEGSANGLPESSAPLAFAGDGKSGNQREEVSNSAAHYTDEKYQDNRSSSAFPIAVAAASAASIQHRVVHHTHRQTHYCRYDTHEDNTCYKQPSVVVADMGELMTDHACKFFVV